MPKRSSKSKSKRLPLRKKYKILKKVKDHHKKKAKEAKIQERGKQKVLKDPGIPAQWPFREQELAALEAKRARTLEEIERKKQEKKEARAAKRKASTMDVDDADGEDEGLAALAQQAEAREQDFERQRKKKAKLEGGGLNDGSRRAYYKEFLKVVEAADVIIQVLDARDPLGSRCKEVERLVLKSGGLKRMVLLLNKIDLVPREVAEQWLKYLREELPTVAFKASTQLQKGNLGQKSLPSATSGAGALQGSESLGADTLLQLLKNYSRNQNLKTSITVGVVGFPNVGKSSLINSLKRSKVANVGATPGVTRSMQEIQLDKNVKLLDCPGIVFSSAVGNEAAAALRNAVKVEKLEDPILPVSEILRLCPPEQLMSIYKIAKFKDVDEFLRAVAASRGKLKKGGVPDITGTARVVLHDWNGGAIPYYTSPPKRAAADVADAAVVAGWGKEFDVEAVFANETSTVIAGLPSLQEGEYAKLPAGRPPQMEGAEGLPESEGEEEEEEEQATTSDMDDEERVAKGSTFEHEHRGTAYLNQTQILYDAEGIYNPHAARAARKQKKKAEKLPEDDGSDYDFETDYRPAATNGVRNGAKAEEVDAEEESAEEEGSEGEEESEGEEGSGEEGDEMAE
ncbi:GTP-binding family protein [Klebsormidium nitens]|uniref:GTP-binding family protein n=1 Tax=Klebsormidium nitens TaxID=105231 RepID=A0A1Y1I929_KLENI|nr:GTP-binding family protein [Klebsormidium nitens]|eukprot:GAQ85196.1 GTP-binding family protein [Klebsormidium nitens]